MFRVKGKTTQLSKIRYAYKPVAASKKTRNPSLTLKKYASTAPAKKSNSTGIKISGGIALLCGGGLIGGTALYYYNSDFRDYVNKSLPIIETFNLALGPIVSPNTNNNKTGDGEESFLKPKDESLKPVVEVKPLKKKKSAEDDVKLKKPLNTSSFKVASLSSIDQVPISSVDLDIATAVEDEVKHSKKDTPPLAKDREQPKKAATPKQVVTVSALDQAGVSSVDLDIARTEKSSAEPKAFKIEEVASTQEPEKPKLQSKEDVILSKPLDTSLTEKEVESLLDQTAMEVLIEEALLMLGKYGQQAVASQQQATKAVLYHVDQLKHALEMEGSGSIKELSKAVLSSQEAAEVAVSVAKASQIKVNEEIENLHALIKEAESSGAKDAGIKASQEAAKVSYGVLNATAELQKAKAEDLVLGEYQKFFEESKGVLKQELQEIMPGALKEEKGKGKKGADKDTARTETVLLAYARKRLDHLKQELSQHREEEHKRLQQILSVQREEDSKLADMRMQQEMDKLHADFDVRLKKRETELSSDYETALRQQLRRQAAAYSDHLTDVLKVQATELQERHKLELEKKLNEEKHAFSTQLATALSRLRGVESVIDGRAEIEKVNKQSQELWIACQALNSAINKGYELCRPLHREVNAIHDAAPGDPAVNRVLDAIPEEALEKGVHSVENLSARFPKVQRECRRVAMIGEESSGPWTYFLSYIQSFFIFDKFDPAKEGELIEIETINTFGLLARAEYYLRAGDLEIAARFVNQLKGEPRRLAYDWLLEVRLLLETRQAAQFLASYAAATGMGGGEKA